MIGDSVTVADGHGGVKMHLLWEKLPVAMGASLKGFHATYSSWGAGLWMVVGRNS